MKNIEEILNSLKQKNINITVGNIVKTGKEAIVYKAYFGNELVALKVYKDYNLRGFTNNQVYLAGKYIRRPSLRKAVAKRTKVGKDFTHESWVRREYVMLNKLYSLGCHIPKPLAYVKTAILMEFIGNEMEVAPKIKDVVFTVNQAKNAFEAIITDMGKYIEAGIIHADLSEFNILWWKDKPYIIDFPQSINIKENSNAEFMLKRDLKNVSNYFSKYFEINKDSIFASLKKSLDEFVIYGKNPY